MKLLSLLTFAFFVGQLSFSQDLLNNVSAYEAEQLTQKSTGYNDFLNRTLVAPEGKKFVVIYAKVNQDVEKDIKVDSEELIFEAASIKYLPVGYLDKGEISFKSVRDLSMKYEREIGYIYSVDKSVSKGELKLGTIPTVAIASIGKSAPAPLQPKLMKVVSNSVLDKFDAKEDYESQKDVKSDFKVLYTPFSGKWLKVDISVLAPQDPTALKNSNYNFHPKDFYISAADGSLYKCAAFIRDGDYDDPFSESMNNNVSYTETEPKNLTLVFFFGDSKGDFKLYHKGIESGIITVK